MTRKSDAERQRAIDRLRELLKPGDTVYTILRHVSRSGMSRRISVVLLHPDGSRIIDLHPNYLVAQATRLRLATGSHDGIVMGGCGMDMGFALVYELSYCLYPDGFGCIGEGCPSNDHSNGDRDYTPHALDAEELIHGRNHTHWHTSGGYALRHRWL